MSSLAAVVLAGLLSGSPQDSYAALMRARDVANALEHVKANEAWVVDQQISLCEIPAPPFKEQQRAEAYKAVFESLGLVNVRIDAVGNVLGERPGTGGGPHLVFSAHLDTV